MFLGSKKAFTLIELLIVVAIIGILAAIAVPNFLNAQIRAKIARAVADMRNVGVAYNCYAVDYNEYPLGVWSENPRISDGYGYLSVGLTTPLSYMTTLPIDEYKLNDKTATDSASEILSWRLRYCTARKKPYLGGSQGSRWMASTWASMWLWLSAYSGIDGEYLIFSYGPDCRGDILPPPSYISLPHTSVVYAASNGLVSAGDIVYSPCAVAGI